MNEKLLPRRLLVILVFLVIFFYSLSALGKYGGGSGTPEDPYQIWDANHMQAIGADANDWDKHFVLMADIDLAQFDGRDGREKFNIIGSFSWWPPDSIPFSGSFDGSDHTILNYVYISPDTENVGLFGHVAGEQAAIMNLGIVDGYVEGKQSVGMLVGYNEGTIMDCYSTGSVLGTGPYTVGGLVGLNGFGDSNALIVNCSSSAHVVGAGNQIGGLIGANIGGSVVNSSATGSVSGIDFVGGLAGSNFGSNAGDFLWHCYSGGAVTGSNSVGGLVGNNNHTIGKCFAVGSVEGGSSVGGLVGHMEWGQISECYAICDISGSAEDIAGLVGNKQGGDIVGCYSAGSLNGIGRPRGGLVGDNEAGNIEHSYWDIQASSEPNMCGNPDDPNCDNSYGKTTAEMKQQSTFQDWDFINVWNIGENQTYPYLRKYSAANINKDQIVNFLDLAIISQQWLEEI